MSLSEKELLQEMKDLAKVHDTKRKTTGMACPGLPYCASCRAVVLIKSNFDANITAEVINTIEPGTVCRIEVN